VRDDSAKTIDCHDKVVSGAEVILSTASAQTSLGKTTWKGRLTFTWDTLAAVLDTDEPPDVGTVEVRGYGGAGRIDLSAGKAFFAKSEIETVMQLVAADKVDEAASHLTRAAALGGDVEEAKRALASAPTSLARLRASEERARSERAAQNKKAEGHLDRARELLRRKQLDDADAELAAARRLGAAVDTLSAQVTAVRAQQAIAQWKKHVTQCRKLSTIRAKLSAVPRCDAECQTISRRVERDWDDLGREKLDLAGVSDEQSQALRDMCEQAGCPECPQ
jgi:hypothetical protein